jgi:small conductance mechanosensitive channel
MDTVNVQSLLNSRSKLENLFLSYAPKLFLAIVTLVIGWWLIQFLNRVITKGLLKSRLDTTVTSFLSSLIGAALKVLLLVNVAGMIGIQTTSFVAVLGAAGLAVGLALQGSLSNFAGGVLILLIKPFQVDDYIEAQGQKGIVSTIQLFHTFLKTEDNKVIIIPNGALSNGIIVNHSREHFRRGELKFWVAKEYPLDTVQQLLLQGVRQEADVVPEPVPAIVVDAIEDTGVRYLVQYWYVYKHSSRIQYNIQQQIKTIFDQKNIPIKSV